MKMIPKKKMITCLFLLPLISFFYSGTVHASPVLGLIGDRERESRIGKDDLQGPGGMALGTAVGCTVGMGVAIVGTMAVQPRSIHRNYPAIGCALGAAGVGGVLLTEELKRQETPVEEELLQGGAELSLDPLFVE